MNDERSTVQVQDAKGRESADFRGLDRLFESVFGEAPLFGFRHARQSAGWAWMPAVDIRETEGELIVTAALPGLDKGDVTLEVKDDTLTLSGTMKAPGNEEESWVRRELPRGEFHRAFQLPADVQAGKAKAAMRNGLLEIRLPKAAEARPRRVEID